MWVRSSHVARLGDAAVDVAIVGGGNSSFTPDHGRAAAPVLADLMADELEWDAAQRSAELDRFQDELGVEGL